LIKAIAQPLGLLLNYIYGIVNNYGLSIVVFTLIIKLVLLPLTLKQTQSMKQMQELNPKLKELQKKYAHDKQKLNEKTMELYRQHNVNPAGGCLPLLIQLPILFALFQVLRTPTEYNIAQEAVVQNFLWIKDLSAPDTGIIIPGSNFGIPILPILAAATTYYQSKMMSTGNVNNPSQNTMNIVMPLMIGWFSLKFPSGLALYWVLSNVFQIVQQYFTMRPGKVVKEESN
jgi:YidC/Oxa1 family membrane protein insertase